MVVSNATAAQKLCCGTPSSPILPHLISFYLWQPLLISAAAAACVNRTAPCVTFLTLYVLVCAGPCCCWQPILLTGLLYTWQPKGTPLLAITFVRCCSQLLLLLPLPSPTPCAGRCCCWQPVLLSSSHHLRPTVHLAAQGHTPNAPAGAGMPACVYQCGGSMGASDCGGGWQHDYTAHGRGGCCSTCGRVMQTCGRGQRCHIALSPFTEPSAHPPCSTLVQSVRCSPCDCFHPLSLCAAGCKLPLCICVLAEATGVQWASPSTQPGPHPSSSSPRDIPAGRLDHQ